MSTPSSVAESNYSYSISQIGATVKQIVKSVITEQDTAREKAKWRLHKRKSQALAQKLWLAASLERDQEIEKRSWAMRNCNSLLTINTCTQCGKIQVMHANYCRDRLCPTCQWRLALRRAAEMSQVLTHIKDCKTEPLSMAMLNLTVRNVSLADLRKTIENMAEGYKRLTKYKIMREWIRGWGRALEVTYNRKEDTYHPHYHVILLIPRDDYTHPERQIQALWRKALNIDYDPIWEYHAIQTRPDDDSADIWGALLETYKYIAKPQMYDDMSATALVHYARVISGVRQTSYGGIIRDTRRILLLRDTDTPDNTDTSEDGTPSEQITICTSCNAETTREIIEWANLRQDYIRHNGEAVII